MLFRCLNHLFLLGGFGANGSSAQGFQSDGDSTNTTVTLYLFSLENLIYSHLFSTIHFLMCRCLLEDLTQMSVKMNWSNRFLSMVRLHQWKSQLGSNVVLYNLFKGTLNYMFYSRFQISANSRIFLQHRIWSWGTQYDINPIISVNIGAVIVNIADIDSQYWRYWY